MNQNLTELYSTPQLQALRGKWQYGDKFHNTTYKHEGYATSFDLPLMEERDDNIWIPLAIDPFDPDRIARGEKPRGLVEMIQGFLSIAKGSIGWVVGVYDEDIDGRERLFQGATPTEALLIALREQWKEKKCER